LAQASAAKRKFDTKVACARSGAKLDCVLERQFHAVLEFADAARVACVAALACRPVAGREIVQHQFQAVALQAAQDLLRLEGVGKQELDGVEAGRAGGGEAFEEAEFVEQQAQVGGESWHAIV
jgi:hypothetical protein